jgi:hypothetical protein
VEEGPSLVTLYFIRVPAGVLVVGNGNVDLSIPWIGDTSPWTTRAVCSASLVCQLPDLICCKTIDAICGLPFQERGQSAPIDLQSSRYSDPALSPSLSVPASLVRCLLCLPFVWPVSPQSPTVDRGVLPWLWLMGRLSIGCIAIVDPLLNVSFGCLSPSACLSLVRHSQTRMLMKGKRPTPQRLTPRLYLRRASPQSSFVAESSLSQRITALCPLAGFIRISNYKYISTVACDASRIGQVTSLISPVAVQLRR